MQWATTDINDIQASQKGAKWNLISEETFPSKNQRPHEGSSWEMLQGGGVKGQLSLENSPHPSSA